MELKGGKKIQISNSACLEGSLDNQMPTSNGLVENQLVVVLRDTECSGVIVKRDLVKKEPLTGKIGYVMTVARTLLKIPFVNVEVSTPYFSETVKALCLKDLLYELIIEIFSEREHPTILMRLGA